MDQQEFDYLRLLHAQGRQEDLSARIRDLKEFGHPVSEAAEALGLTRQRIYVLLKQYPNAESPVDGAEIEDIREVEELEPDLLVMERAKLPPLITDTISALWRINLRDRSAGTSERSRVLDTMVALLLRRGVPNLAIGQEVGVTHRAVIARMIRAVERQTLPDEFETSFLSAVKYREHRELQERIPGRNAFALFQVVSNMYPRFYTMRDENDHLFVFDANRPNKRLEELGFDEFDLLTTEEEFTHAIADALPDESPIYAAPAHWLYVESTPPYLWDSQNYGMTDFIPSGLLSKFEDPLVKLCFDDPAKVLTDVPPIDWKAN